MFDAIYTKLPVFEFFNTQTQGATYPYLTANPSASLFNCIPTFGNYQLNTLFPGAVPTFGNIALNTPFPNSIPTFGNISMGTSLFNKAIPAFGNFLLGSNFTNTTQTFRNYNLFASNPFNLNYNNMFGSGLGGFSPTNFNLVARTKSNNETYHYDQATVDKLVNKYKGALNHVGDKKEFVKKVVDLASRHNIDPNDLLIIFYSEGGLNPSADGGIFGLMKSTAKNYNIDIDKFRKKSASEQLDIYERVLNDQLKMAYGTTKPSTKVTSSILYAMNFTPAYVKEAIKDANNGGEGILVAANSSDPDKRRFFNANKGKGTVADGTDHISFKTIQVRMDRKEREASSLA